MSLGVCAVVWALVSIAAAVDPLAPLTQWRLEPGGSFSPEPVKLMSNATPDLLIAVQSNGVVRAIDILSGAGRWASSVFVSWSEQPTALIIRGDDAFVASPTTMTLFRVSTGEKVLTNNVSFTLRDYSWYHSDPNQIYATADGTALCKIDMRTLAVTKVKAWSDAIITFALVSPHRFVVVTERSVELISDNGTAIDSATVAFNSLPLVVGSDLYF